MFFSYATPVCQGREYSSYLKDLKKKKKEKHLRDFVTCIVNWVCDREENKILLASSTGMYFLWKVIIGNEEVTYMKKIVMCVHFKAPGSVQ